MQYATFQTSMGIMTGIVNSVNSKTIRVSPVKFGRRSLITGSHPITEIGHQIVLHIDKHGVRVWPIGIVPIN